MKKSGGGGRNWGNDAAAGMDNAAAGAENDGDGPAGNWGANGAAPNAEVRCCWCLALCVTPCPEACCWLRPALFVSRGLCVRVCLFFGVDHEQASAR